ncbi:hypothetical protein [Acetonema longum]|uniref:Uncharacterized protein n=1 Tax=Acetonema longum DSM 6540 TaxID=1009370 RepID=F7NKF7_9FIRM|nr:hypothetical protein [Acetonema longum]EGO63598.1 hypothetical protein ALO_12851 [Acetonema longum DSM 6540]
MWPFDNSDTVMYFSIGGTLYRDQIDPFIKNVLEIPKSKSFHPTRNELNDFHQQLSIIDIERKGEGLFWFMLTGKEHGFSAYTPQTSLLQAFCEYNSLAYIKQVVPKSEKLYAYCSSWFPGDPVVFKNQMYYIGKWISIWNSYSVSNIHCAHSSKNSCNIAFKEFTDQTSADWVLKRLEVVQNREVQPLVIKDKEVPFNRSF